MTVPEIDYESLGYEGYTTGMGSISTLSSYVPDEDDEPVVKHKIGFY